MYIVREKIEGCHSNTAFDHLPQPKRPDLVTNAIASGDVSWRGNVKLAKFEP